MEWLLALPFFIGFVMASAGVDFTDRKLINGQEGKESANDL